MVEDKGEISYINGDLNLYLKGSANSVQIKV